MRPNFLVVMTMLLGVVAWNNLTVFYSAAVGLAIVLAVGVIGWSFYEHLNKQR